jgi:VWFA-related protein
LQTDFRGRISGDVEPPIDVPGVAKQVSATSVRTVVLCALVMLAIRAAAGQQPPRFQSSVDVTSVEVTVVDGSGRPVVDLQPRDFAVRVDRSPRRVVNAQWVSLATAAGAAAAPPPEGYSTNQNSAGGRLIVIAVDQPNIRFEDAANVVRAADGFIDRLRSSDRVAAVLFGQGGGSTPFTNDRQRVKDVLARMTGEERWLDTVFQRDLSISEAFAIIGGQDEILAAVVSRECFGANINRCRQEILEDANVIAEGARRSADLSVASLRALLGGLRTIEAPKTLVLISEGFAIANPQSLVSELATMAGVAHTSVYVLRLDHRADGRAAALPGTLASDRELRSQGLEQLASASRGILLNSAGADGRPLARIEAEISGYYLVGIESDPKDRDGKIHPIAVTVTRRGLAVRSPRQLSASPSAVARTEPTPRDAVTAGLISPLLLSSLPLRVATFSVREPENARVQLLIHADVGVDYASTKAVSLGYVITAPNGRIVDRQAMEARLSPVMNGVPSALQFDSSASLDPGEYTLKLAAAEGDRVGSVEHPIHAGLVPAGPIQLSELMVGGPAASGRRLQPTVGYTVAFGMVHAYMEAYDPSASVAVEYEVAANASAPALLQTNARAVSGGNERTIFSELLPVQQLPPGQYVLRAVISSTGRPVATMTRTFELAAPAVLMTSADSPDTVAPSELYLPVGDEFLARGLQREEALRPDTLEMFRERVTPASQAAFDTGAAFLAAGNYLDAEQSFKSAVTVDPSSTSALAYLGAAYALSGHDAEAADAWRTSLIDGSGFHEIYAWLGDALIRTHELSEARTVLQEAASKWPADTRFAKPLALLYATFGQGREAVRMIERHLTAHEDDQEALALGVQWMYQLHAAGVVAHGPSDDVKLARGWAAAYAKTTGPQASLVRTWMQALEKGQQ